MQIANRKLLWAFTMLVIGWSFVSAQSALPYQLQQSPVKTQTAFGTDPAFAICDMLEYFGNIPAPLDPSFLSLKAKMSKVLDKSGTDKAGGTFAAYRELLYQKALIPEGFAQLDTRKTSPRKPSKKQIVQSTEVLMRYGVPEGAIQIIPKSQVVDPNYIAQLLNSGVKNIAITYGICNKDWQKGLIRETDIGCGILTPHTVCIVGMDSAGFIIKNSWGTEWGEAGYAHITRSFHEKYAQEAMLCWLSESSYPTQECPHCPLEMGLKVTPMVFDGKEIFQFGLFSTYAFPEFIGLEYALYDEEQQHAQLAGGKILLIPGGAINGHPWNVPVPKGPQKFRLKVLAKLGSTGRVVAFNFPNIEWKNLSLTDLRQ